MGWKHKGHLHRPALLLAAWIRNHRHPTRGCASNEGYPRYPPRLLQVALSMWSNHASAPRGLRTPMSNNNKPSTINH